MSNTRILFYFILIGIVTIIASAIFGRVTITEAVIFTLYMIIFYGLLLLYLDYRKNKPTTTDDK